MQLTPPSPANSAAVDEMKRILDGAPQVSEHTYRSDTRMTQRFSHGAVRDRLLPMNEHVVMTYYGPPKLVEWWDGQRYLRTTKRPGCVTVVPRGHEAKWDVRGPVEVSHVYMTETRIQGCADALGAHRGVVELADLVAFQDPIASRLMEILSLEAARNDQASSLFIEQAVDLLCSHLLRVHATTPARTPPSGQRGLANWQVRRVTDYLKDNLDQEVRLDDLACLAGLSRFHFCTAFRKATGLTPHQWLTSLRIARSRELLADPQMPVSTIALAVGYQTPSAFATAFRRVEKITPSQFRERL
jgi:AraC family transcriptional regulator